MWGKRGKRDPFRRNGENNMKYFTEKKNMMNELMEILNDNCNYNIDISKE